MEGQQLTMERCRTSIHKQDVLKYGGNQETVFIKRANKTANEMRIPFASQKVFTHNLNMQ
jgi:hypothetical protein